MIAVWFSHGAPSAVALKLTVEKYGVANVRAVCNPVVEEDEDNFRFGEDVSRWVGIEIEYVTNENYSFGSAELVWEKRRGMSFPKGAPCTTELKKQARQQWEAKNKPDWHVFGFTLEEKKRHERFVLTERENVLPVLIDAGYTRQMCAMRLRQDGLVLPRIYSWGYPNANCIGCVKATSPTYWNLVRKTHPEVFEARARLSRELGSKLTRVRNKRIFLDELDPSQKGRPLKSMPDCGVICEEWSK